MTYLRSHVYCVTIHLSLFNSTFFSTHQRVVEVTYFGLRKVFNTTMQSQDM